MTPMRALRSFLAVAAVVIGAVEAVPDATSASYVFAPAASNLSQLRGIDELKSWFNGYKGHPRLIFLVSPT